MKAVLCITIPIDEIKKMVIDHSKRYLPHELKADQIDFVVGPDGGVTDAVIKQGIDFQFIPTVTKPA